MIDSRFLPIIPIAQASHAKFFPRGPFVSIDLAQWGVESGYGKHMSGLNNPFGIKATSEQRAAGQARLVLTHEYIGGRYVAMEQWFANYASLEAAFDAHAQLLTTPHYQRCVDATTPAEYAQALHDCGYATAPNYPAALMAVINSNGLAKFDIANPATPDSSLVDGIATAIKDWS
jgi:flagellum-specific peptidoglycan hydrolase FlgJ